MHNIETEVLNNYAQNLSYLEKHHPSLHKKITHLDYVIAEGLYKERYILEYKENTYFDVQECISKTWLYSENSIEYSHRLENLITFKKTGGVFHGLPKVELDSTSAERINQSPLTFHNTMWATAKIISHNYTIAHKSLTSMHKIYKIMFLGSGLGLHLDEITKKFNPKVLYIKEDDLELFRLSLFVTNYSNLAIERLLVFSVAQDEESIKNSFHEFLDYHHHYNLYIKFLPFNKNYETLLQQLQSYVLQQDYIAYSYSACLLRYINSPKYLTQNYNFLNISKIYKNSIFAQKPVLLVASGPSTSKNIEWLKEHQEEFIIVAPLSTVKFLFIHKIAPTVIIHIDPGIEQTLLLFDGIDEDFLKKPYTILSPHISEKITAKFDQKKLFFVEQGTEYKFGFGNLSAPTVGEYSYALLLLLGAKTLYLLGIDFALDSTTLSSHVESHPFAKQGEKHFKSDISGSIDYKKTLYYVKGNFQNQVPTLASFLSSIGEFKRFTGMLKKHNQAIYNLSNGAYLEGAVPLLPQDIPTLEKFDKEILLEDIGAFFNFIASGELRKEDRAILEYQLKKAKYYKKRIKRFKTSNLDSADSFLEALCKLENELSKTDKKPYPDLAEVYERFFKISLNYIFDIINTSDIDCGDTEIETVKRILVEQLDKITNTYISEFSKYLGYNSTI